MTFFNYTPPSETQPGQREVSGKFWIYWAVTAPITVAVLIAWSLWQLSASRKARQNGLRIGDQLIEDSKIKSEVKQMSQVG